MIELIGLLKPDILIGSALSIAPGDLVANVGILDAEPAVRELMEFVALEENDRSSILQESAAPGFDFHDGPELCGFDAQGFRGRIEGIVRKSHAFASEAVRHRRTSIIA
jgi:hypothetical protein